MKIYIYTIPKAGTYFLAAVLEKMGFRNTGWHVNRNNRLNTKTLSVEQNATHPSTAMQDVNFFETLRDIKENEFAFGHFPVPLMAWTFRNFNFLCAYRHPRKTLVSEFIDFRFRRNDVQWASKGMITDDQEAFLIYMRRHAHIQAEIFSSMLAVRLLVKDGDLFGFPAAKFCFVNFDRLLANPDELRPIAQCLNVDRRVDFVGLHADTLAIETKTKATGLHIDREKFWTSESESEYEAQNFDRTVARMREAGLDL
ncbi:MAG: hypothetical protein ABI832_21220 [bacterium]